MIALISGRLIEKELGGALLIDVGGIGYRVRVLQPIWEQAHVGDRLSLRIYHHVGAEEEELYGFAEPEHLRFFHLLLTVPSVGVKTAMGILSIASPSTLAQAVADEDITLLTKVSGVGKKTAQRILVELKGKIEVPSQRQAAGSVQEEAISALTSLGYSKAEARKAVSALPADVTTVEEAVRFTLREKEPHR